MSRRNCARLILLALLLLLAVLLVRAAPSSAFGVGEDFMEYWAAARLNLAGGDPYSPAQMLAVEQANGWLLPEPRMMWNPPAMLVLVLPLAVLSYPAALLLWRIAAIVACLLCAGWLWRLYGGPKQRSYVAALACALYLPTLLVVSYGQIGWLLLMGLVGFLHFQKCGRLGLAGLCLSLLALKFQLLPVLWLAILYWVVRTRSWPVLIGLAAGVAAPTIVAAIMNPEVAQAYAQALISNPVAEWITPTPGALLRLLFGWEYFWLAFLPAALGSLWFLWSRSRHAEAWQWPDRMPVLLFAALASSPYAWLHDHIVLLIPIVGVLASSAHRGKSLLTAGLSYMLLFALCLPTARFAGLVRPAPSLAVATQAWNVWIVPAFALWYLALRYWGQRRNAASQEPDA